MRRIPTTLSFVVAIALISCVGSGYDKARYDQMRRGIDSSTNKLLGL
jgi:hypothetical protein